MKKKYGSLLRKWRNLMRNFGLISSMLRQKQNNTNSSSSSSSSSSSKGKIIYRRIDCRTGRDYIETKFKMKMFKYNESLNGTAAKEDSKYDGKNCETKKCDNLTFKEEMEKQVTTILHDNLHGNIHGNDNDNGCKENISNEIKKQENKNNNINEHINEYEKNKEKEYTDNYVEDIEDMDDVEDVENGEDDDKRTIHMFQFRKNRGNVNNILEQQKIIENEEQEKEKYRNVKYDDGNPEIKYFTNKNNLKIARYAWNVENPKAYVFAIHGITSHLRNEYLCYKGRPTWVDEMNKNEEKEKNESKEKTESKEKIEEKDQKEETIIMENKEQQNLSTDDMKHKETLNINTEENRQTKKEFSNNTTSSFSNDSTTIHKKHVYSEIKNTQLFTDSVNYERDHLVRFQNKKKNEQKQNEDIHFDKSIKLQVVDDVDSYKWDDNLNKDTDKNIWETIEEESHETLRPFVSCSSCLGDESTSSDIFEKIKGHRLSDCVYREISTHKLVEDENILTIEENEMKQHIHPNDVYFCSNCGISKGCECGNRVLSYTNSWVELFNKNQFSFFGIDNQSHGLSEGWENQRCNVQNFENFVTDAIDALDIFIEEWKQENKMKPIIIMGLSMGGCIALKTAEKIFRINKPWKDYVKGLILVSPMISLEKRKQKLINKILIPVSKVLNYFYPHFTLSVKETNEMYPWIVKDSKNDPLQYFGPLKIKIAVECINAADNCLNDMTMEQIDQSDINVLILQSKYDSIVDPKGAIDFMNKILNVREKKKTGETETKCEDTINEEEENEKNNSHQKSKSLDATTTHLEMEEINVNEQSNINQHTEKRKVNTQDSLIENIQKNDTEEKRKEILGNEKKQQNQEKDDNENEKEKKEDEKKENEKKDENKDELWKKDIVAIKVPRSAHRYSELTGFINADERYSFLDSDNFAQTKHKVWSSFEYGYYKKFDFLKSRKQENTDGNVLENADNYKTFTVYILKCGCHTLPSEPETKEVAHLIVDWANDIFPENL